MTVQEHASPYVREVGGDVVSSLATGAPHVRLEFITRRSVGGVVSWHFRQRELCLFFFERGAERLRARIDGTVVDHRLTGAKRLCLVPPGSEIDGAWDAAETADYAVAFIDPALIQTRLGAPVERPIVGFPQAAISAGLAALRRAALEPDRFFELLLEGWSLQALSHIGRVNDAALESMTRLRGGLPSRSVRRVDDFVRSNLQGCIDLASLSQVAGLSKRQFLRAFKESVGATPYQYVLAMRIAYAKERLLGSGDNVSEIAIATGFTQSEHFATTFKRHTGVSPKEYRRTGGAIGRGVVTRAMEPTFTKKTGLR